MITVYDAISDLPVIKSGDQTEERSYNQKAKTHFQRMVSFYVSYYILKILYFLIIYI